MCNIIPEVEKDIDKRYCRYHFSNNFTYIFAIIMRVIAINIYANSFRLIVDIEYRLKIIFVTDRGFGNEFKLVIFPF